MDILRGLHPPKVVRARYNFDELRHGDAFTTPSPAGARSQFARWKRRTGRRRVGLRADADDPNLLFFIDYDRVEHV